MKILVSESIAKEGIDFLIEKGFTVDIKLALSKEELVSIISDYDALIVRSVTNVRGELLENASNLKVVGRAGNGVDNIDIDECTKRGIIVVNTPESNTMAAGELAVAMAFASFRNLTIANQAVRKGDFRRSSFIGNELDGKTAGIIGLGRIGTIVAGKFKGCNMKVVAYDPYITDEKFENIGVEKCDTLEKLLKKSDLITMHTPKTSETYGMIGEKEIESCKDNVRIINAARGGLVNEKALYNAIKAGKVAGAGIDVLDPEPGYNLPPEEQTYTNPLLELDSVIITPHLGASTREATYNVGTSVAKRVASALVGEIVPAVNMPQMKGGDFEKIKPYLKLAEKLGSIYYQAEKITVNKIEVICKGDLASLETKPIVLSAIKGFLSPIVKDNVNYVNAESYLDNMGIKLVESKSKDVAKYSNMITINFHTKDKVLSLSGAMVLGNEMRIVDFFGYNLEFVPTEYVIAIQNNDRPGVIGKLGTIFGEENINIAEMQCSRNKKGAKAVAFIAIDNFPEPKTLERIKGIDGIIKATLLEF